MKSLPTKYKGYNFRSRTEARWAVFFDAMGITYLYEHEDVVLPNGRRYLPDFYLPKFDRGAYCEVKGEFTADEKILCYELAKHTQKCVILLEGVPDFKTYYYFNWHDDILQDASYLQSILDITGEGMPIFAHKKEGVYLNEGIFCSPFSKYGERMFVEPGFSRFKANDWYSEYEHAVHAARGAQFEFQNK